MSDFQRYLDILLMFAVILLVVALLWSHFRYEGFISAYRKALTYAASSCPLCHGGGTLSHPGATRVCSYCGPIRHVLKTRP